MAQNGDKKSKRFIRGSGRKNGYDRYRFVFTGFNKLTGEETPFFIEYYLLNPQLSPRSIVFQPNADHFIDLNVKSSYVMIKAGLLGSNQKQINNFYTVENLVINKKKQILQIGECTMTANQLIGNVTMSEVVLKNHPEYQCSSGSISWNLHMEKKYSYGEGYASSWFFSLLNSLEMFWSIHGLKTAFSGTISVDNQEYSVSPQSSFGYSDSYWGKGFPNPWIWLTGSNAVSQISGKRLNDTCFAVSGCYSRLFSFKKKQRMIVYATIEGTEYEFNFTKPWTLPQINYQCIESDDCLHWLVSASNHKNVVDIDIFCKAKDMMVKAYESALGNEGKTDIFSGETGFGELRVYKKVGKNLETIECARIKNASCEYGEIDTE